MDKRRLRKTDILRLVTGILVASAFALGIQDARAPTVPGNRHKPHNFVGRQGMVVAAHPLAAQAGLDMLKKGGNAVDAAVATTFALNAAEPFASGIGGGGFMVIYLARQDKITVINFREKAPARATPRMFLQDGTPNREWKREHGLAVAVPGALAGWSYALKKYGTRTLGEVMQRGIEIAETGLAVSTTFSRINKDEYEKLLKNSGESSCYLQDGFPYEPGETFRNPELASTFRRLAEKGVEDFYRGDLARLIVEAVEAKGGVLSLEDLAEYRPLEQEPLQGTYKEYTIFTLPPPGSGGLHILQLLNIIENWPVQEWGHNSPLYIHHLSEAFRAVFADRECYLGDPDFVEIPVGRLISKAYAARIASRIKPDRILGTYRAGEFLKEEDGEDNTTHLCVLDREGNIVSLTQSINHFFGTGIVPEGTGMLLNCHMDDFSDDPHSPNAPGPGHRPLSAMGPLIMFQGRRPVLVLGSPGGTRIFPTLTQIILNITEFGMSLDEAIEAPRFFSFSSQNQGRPISLESRIPEAAIKALQALGHQTRVREAYDKYFGGAQGLMILHNKAIILGGADSRRDGFGAGY